MTSVAAPPPSLCAHCGLPVSVRHRHADESVFCCYGCEVAAHILGTGDEAGARLAMYKLAAGVILGINVMMFSMPLYVESLGAFFRQGFGSESYFSLLKWLLMVLSLPVYFLLGMPFVESSLHSLREGVRTNADLLIALGVTAAMLVSMFDTIFISGPVYYETAVAILVIVTLGRYLEARARAKATRVVEEMTDRIPSLVSVICEDGTLRDVSVASLSSGDTILSKPGEIVPVDCMIVSGSAMISEAMLTGESEPLRRSSGDMLLAGAVNYDGLLRLTVLHQESESYIQRLRALLLESKQQRAKIQQTSDRIAATAVPVIVVVALASLLYWSFAQDLRHGLFAFLGVVLVACPCAIGIATPAALWYSVMQASRRGILFRSLGVVERLAHAKRIYFDKTGTLTNSVPAATNIIFSGEHANDESRSPLLGDIAAVASFSSHPLSKAIARTFMADHSRATLVRDLHEIASKGVSARIEDATIMIGSAEFVGGKRSLSEDSTSVWCSIEHHGDTRSVFEITFLDEPKKEAASVFQELHRHGYKTSILSGDERSVAEKLGSELGSDAFGKLTPLEKRTIVASEPDSIFVGDGFNDAGAIGAANVGIAMGSGSDLIRTEADVILFDNDLHHIPELLHLAKRTMRIVKQNLFWAFFYNIIGVALAAAGMLNPIIAALAMALSSLAVAQNSMRLSRTAPVATAHA